MIRTLIIVAVGWLSLSAEAPAPSSKPKANASAENMALSAQNIVDARQVAEYTRACLGGEDRRGSDLCAQWKAADAGAQAAYWAYWQIWVGVVGAVGLIAALGLTLRSNRIARQALAVTRDTAQRELRAYVFPQRVSWEIRQSRERYYLIFRVVWKNLGSTPTKDLRISNVGTLDGVPMNQIPDFDQATQFLLGPGAEINSNSVALGMKDAHDVYKCTKQFHLLGFAFYQDIFSKQPRKTRHQYRIRLFRDSSKRLTGHNFSWIEWEIDGDYNCADDECDLIEATKRAPGSS